MLHWINKQGVQSDDGWMLQRETRFTYSYHENDRVLTLPVEDAKLFLSDLLVWKSPNGDIAVVPQERTLIEARLREALKFMETGYTVVSN